MHPSYRAHVLCANTVSQLNSRLWPSCHSRHGWGVFCKNKQYSSLASTCPHFWLLLIFAPVTPRSQSILSRSPLPDGLGLHLLTPRCLVTFDSIVHLLDPFCLTLFESTSIFSLTFAWRHPTPSSIFLSSLHFTSLPPDGLLIQHDFLSSRFHFEVTAFRTRHSISMCCLYVRTSLAPRLDNKKVHISLFTIPRLNFTSLHSRSAILQTSTPQTASQQTSTQSTSAQHASTQPTSTQQTSTCRQSHFIQPVIFDFAGSALNSIFGLLWHTATTTKRPASVSS